MSERHHVTTIFPTEYVRAGNRASLTCRSVELGGDVVTPGCALAGCPRLACNARTCKCPPCECDTCTARRLKATFNATELPDG